MPTLRVALAQCSLVVGDLAGNAATLRAAAAEARAAGAQLLVTPEMALTGYPPEDLVLRHSFLSASAAALRHLAADLAVDGAGELAVVVGYLDAAAPPPVPALVLPDLPDVRPTALNAAAVLWRGEVAATQAKHHLPNYGVFDERRYFVPGRSVTVVRLDDVDVALTICEDLWQPGGPVESAAAAGAGLVVCLNGSPYERGKNDVRVRLCARAAAVTGAPVAYVNQVGGQDELVFDGGSVIVGADGAVLARAPQFTPALLIADVAVRAAATAPAPVAARPGVLPVRRVVLDRSAADGGGRGSSPVGLPAAPVAPALSDCAEVWGALVTGTRDYVRKNGFTGVLLGLSGGIDSAVVATVAVDALGGGAVHTVAMPSAYSSAHSLADAADLAARQGTVHQVLPIAPMVDAYRSVLPLDGLAAENLQARVRGTLLMALSNRDGHLVLTTGNKSELATGFSTLYGDSAGGFAPLKDVPKTLVWALARWRNAEAERRGDTAPIPVNSITKPPSAELAPGQLDSDRLPDYAVLDRLLDDYVTNDRGREQLLAAGHDPAVVDRTVRLVDLAEYKRRQNPPGPKITLRAFGRDRRLPITSRWREGDPPAPGGAPAAPGSATPGSAAPRSTAPGSTAAGPGAASSGAASSAAPGTAGPTSAAAGSVGDGPAPGRGGPADAEAHAPDHAATAR